MRSPTSRSLQKLAEEGWTTHVVETYNPFSRRRIDLFNFADILAISPTRGIMAVQTTSGSNVAARVAKIKAEPKAALWLASNGLITVHGWRKCGKKGKRKVWECREVAIEKTPQIENVSECGAD